MYLIFGYIDFLQNKREDIANIGYKEKANSMDTQLASMLLQKQKSTVALAISLGFDERLVEEIVQQDIPVEYYSALIKKFQDNTLYQNIWIQIFDAELNSIYRSWSDIKGDNLSLYREDLLKVKEDKKVRYSISAGKFDFSIKAIVPIVKGEQFIGVFEVISHFNSLSNELIKSGIDSVVILNKEHSKKLIYPFTKRFLDESYYVANFDAKDELLEYLHSNGIERYLKRGYLVENGYIVLSHPLKSADNKIIGYFMMFSKVDTISSMSLDYFMFRWLGFSLVFVMALAIMFSIYMYYVNRKQKVYYKNIIDTSTNIIVINDKERLLDVNEIFFNYFTNYKNLQEYQKYNSCICDYFVKESGFIYKEMNGLSWMDYLLQNTQKRNKVKLNIEGKIYYFLVDALRISSEREHYSVIMTDITEQEKYQQELEYLSVTDALTGVYNRRYFYKTLELEIKRKVRYGHPLVMIMYDIDYFKQVNDNHGHDIGDKVLQLYTELISSSLREVDTLCRIGGEEFIIILPHINLHQGELLAEKLRLLVEESREVVSITMSFGVVEYQIGEEIDEFFKRADNSLYSAKKSGRNSVVVG